MFYSRGKCMQILLYLFQWRRKNWKTAVVIRLPSCTEGEQAAPLWAVLLGLISWDLLGPDQSVSIFGNTTTEGCLIIITLSYWHWLQAGMLKAQEKYYCTEHSLMCCPCLFKKKVRLFLERLVCKGDGDKCHIYVICATVPWHFRQEETIILVRGLCWLREKGWWQGSNLKLAESNAHELNPDTVWPQAVY